MAEDEGVNGTIWNKEATKLLSLFGWKTIGDYDMDVIGEDDKKYGLDTILNFFTPMKNNPQSVILEAKRYNTNSFSKSILQVERTTARTGSFLSKPRMDEKFRKAENRQLIFLQILFFFVKFTH